MEITYVYTRKRREFGRDIAYSAHGPVRLVDIREDGNLDGQWKEVSTVQRQIGTVEVMSEHDVNTSKITYVDRGMLHREGGWPKEIDPQDVEFTSRYLKKIERDIDFQTSIETAVDRTKKVCLLNNVFDATECYFQTNEEESTVTVEEKEELKAITYFEDPEGGRVVRRIAWGPQGSKSIPQKFATCYSNLEYRYNGQLKGRKNKSMNAHIWDIENCMVPSFTLECPGIPITCLMFDCSGGLSKNSWFGNENVLYGGTMEGYVASWDTRSGHIPTAMSSVEKSHKDPIVDMSLLSYNSRSGCATEIATVSTDGSMLIWDCRKLSEPVAKKHFFFMGEMVGSSKITDWKDIGNECGISETITGQPSGLFFDSTLVGGSCICTDAINQNHPPLVGAVTGHILRVRLDTPPDYTNPASSVSTVYLAHHGSVKCIRRHPYFNDFFMSVGDWSLKLWHDISLSPMRILSGGSALLTGCAWSPSRPSIYFTSGFDGCCNVWDLLSKSLSPIISLRLGKSPLTYVNPERTGRIVSFGDISGRITLCECNNALRFPMGGLSGGANSELELVGDVLEKELKREQNLEHRMKETHTHQKIGRGSTGASADDLPDKVAMQEAEDELFSALRGQRWVK